MLSIFREIVMLFLLKLKIDVFGLFLNFILISVSSNGVDVTLVNMRVYPHPFCYLSLSRAIDDIISFLFDLLESVRVSIRDVERRGLFGGQRSALVLVALLCFYRHCHVVIGRVVDHGLVF